MLETRDFPVPTRHGSVGARVHRPAGGLLPGLVYLHGGGWTLFSLDTHDRVMREYAARTGCCVLGVDYALSPEQKFPVALEQVIDVVSWLATQGLELGIDAGRLAIGGDSAGANLSVAACLVRRDRHPLRRFAPCCSTTAPSSSHCSAEACRRYGGPEYMLGCEEMSRYWRNYLRSDADAGNPLACPLLADRSRPAARIPRDRGMRHPRRAERRRWPRGCRMPACPRERRLSRRIPQLHRGHVDRRGQQPGPGGRDRRGSGRLSMPARGRGPAAWPDRDGLRPCRGCDGCGED